jgi:hypothetical protein
MTTDSANPLSFLCNAGLMSSDRDGMTGTTKVGSH